MVSVNYIEINGNNIPFKLGGYSLSLFLKRKNIKFSLFKEYLEDDLSLLYEVIYLGVENGYRKEQKDNPYTLESFAEFIDDYNALNDFSVLLAQSMGGSSEEEKN
jgi:hypothetical protein